jgi:hypothetical protein
MIPWEDADRSGGLGEWNRGGIQKEPRRNPAGTSQESPWVSCPEDDRRGSRRAIVPFGS